MQPLQGGHSQAGLWAMLSADPQTLAFINTKHPLLRPICCNRVGTPKTHVGEALRAQRAPPPPLTPQQRDAARLQALQDAAKPRQQCPASGADPLTGESSDSRVRGIWLSATSGQNADTQPKSQHPTSSIVHLIGDPGRAMVPLRAVFIELGIQAVQENQQEMYCGACQSYWLRHAATRPVAFAGDLFAEVPLEAMLAPKQSSSVRPATVKPGAKAGAYLQLAEGSPRQSLKDPAVPQATATIGARSARSGAMGRAAAVTPAADKSGGKVAGTASLQLNASSAAASTASRWQPSEPGSPVAGGRGQGESRGWLSHLFPRRHASFGVPQWPCALCQLPCAFCMVACLASAG